MPVRQEEGRSVGWSGLSARCSLTGEEKRLSVDRTGHENVHVEFIRFFVPRPVPGPCLGLLVS